MDTRADFYIRKEGQMKWLGSQGWDGYPDGIENKVLSAADEGEFESVVNEYLSRRNDATFTKDGWPWPWNDSCTTDYAYIFENGKVLSSCFGGPLFDPLKLIEGDGDSDTVETKSLPVGYFPDMKDIKNIAYDNRSGAIFISFSGK
jgi:hypothetical protein